jgi:outer membrane protein assembly factor BamB
MPRATVVHGLLCVSLLLGGCGGGGGGGGFPTGPFIPWGKFRRDNSNSGVASASVINNEGKASLFYDNTTAPTGTPAAETTLSSPAVGGDGVVYLGTSNGLIKLDEAGQVLWHLESCSFGENERRLGTILSSPTIVANDEDLLVGTEGTDGTDGAIFRIAEDRTGAPFCVWSFPEPNVAFATRSSAVEISDPNDFALISLFIGSADGRLLAIAADGTRRWTFSPNEPAANLSSSPAFSAVGVIVTTANGNVYSLDPSGRPSWRFSTGEAYSTRAALLPSPATQGAIYVVQGRNVIALNVDGTERWRRTEADEIVGSPAASVLTIPREGGGLTQEPVVYTVDHSGTLTATVNSTGKLVRFCSLVNETCVPSTCPGEITCVESRRCSISKTQCGGDQPNCPDGEDCETKGRCGAEDGTIECTPDSCEDDTDAGLCTREASLPISTGTPIEVESSPALSLDNFIVVGTTDGRICARRIDGAVPGGECMISARSCLPDSCPSGDRCCDADDADGCVPGYCRATSTLPCTPDSCRDDDPSDICKSPWVADEEGANLENGCISLPAGNTTTLSSPAIAADGEIFVTTDRGLVKVE